MSNARKKRSRPSEPKATARLVQTTVSGPAKDELRRRAANEAISESAYVRRVLYRDLGFFAQEKTNG